MCSALYSSDGYSSYDIICRTSSGQVVDGCCDTLGNRAIGLCLAQSLHQLVADIAGIQIREDQYISLSCHFTIRCL